MKDVMLDIETLGTAPGSMVISIGAVGFDAEGIGPEFYGEPSWTSCLQAGLKPNHDTMLWWKAQSISPPFGYEDLAVILDRLDSFLLDRGFARIWANSPAFDCVLLEAAYRALGRSAPWDHRMPRDLRTALEANPGFDKASVPAVGVAHHALDDAKWQARVLIASGWFARNS